jgi:pilus assembly protein CpaB
VTSTQPPSSRRRRAVLLLALALTAGGLAASQVRSSVEEVEARVGAPVPVVVASEDISGGTRLDPGKLQQMLTVRDVPASFAPPDSLAAPEEALGLRAAVPIATGRYVTSGDLETGIARGGAGPVLAPGQRVVEIAVAGGAALAATGPGARVDVVVTTGAETGAGRTYVALQRVELVGVATPGGGGGGSDDAAAAGATASLRVTLQQAVLLTAAQNFAREIRLLPRSPEDTERVGPTSVEAADL